MAFTLVRRNKMKPHRFYIAQQPHLEPGELFVFHARFPKCLFKVMRSTNFTDMELISCFDFAPKEKIEATRKWARDWYYYSFVKEKEVVL